MTPVALIAPTPVWSMIIDMRRASAEIEAVTGLDNRGAIRRWSCNQVESTV